MTRPPVADRAFPVPKAETPRRPGAGRRAPRPLSEALRAFQERIAPPTALAGVQSVWPEVAGATMSAAARPTAERDGTLTLTCEAAVWAQELQLMGPELVRRLNEHLGGDLVREVRCVVGT